jgi:hypothetical protein
VGNRKDVMSSAEVTGGADVVVEAATVVVVVDVDGGGWGASPRSRWHDASAKPMAASAIQPHLTPGPPSLEGASG